MLMCTLVIGIYVQNNAYGLLIKCRNVKKSIRIFPLKKKASSGAIIWGVIFCIIACLQTGKLLIKRVLTLPIPKSRLNFFGLICLLVE